MSDKIFLKSRINKANCQINFQLKKKELSKEFQNKLSRLKGIEIKLEDFDFE